MTCQILISHSGKFYHEETRNYRPWSYCAPTIITLFEHHFSHPDGKITQMQVARVNAQAMQAGKMWNIEEDFPWNLLISWCIQHSQANSGLLPIYAESTVGELDA